MTAFDSKQFSSSSIADEYDDLDVAGTHGRCVRSGPWGGCVRSAAFWVSSRSSGQQSFEPNPSPASVASPVVTSLRRKVGTGAPRRSRRQNPPVRV